MQDYTKNLEKFTLKFHKKTKKKDKNILFFQI
jgi:hypothetical protein